MKKNVLILLAEGFEEVEALTPADFLRRAGIDAKTVSIASGRVVRGSHGIGVEADLLLDELDLRGAPDAWDGVLIPGGMPGAANIAASETASALITAMAGKGKLCAAICAAPAVVLSPLGLLKRKQFTCYPGMEDRVTGAEWTADRVVKDGNIVTSRGPGTAAEWAIKLIEILAGEDEAKKIAADTLQYWVS